MCIWCSATSTNFAHHNIKSLSPVLSKQIKTYCIYPRDVYAYIYIHKSQTKILRVNQIKFCNERYKPPLLCTQLRVVTKLLHYNNAVLCKLENIVGILRLYSLLSQFEIPEIFSEVGKTQQIEKILY